MAKRPALQQTYAPDEQEEINETADVRAEAPRPRRRIQVRAPEDMFGLTLSLLIPNAYLPHLLEAYIAGSKDGSVTRRGRKLPEAVMARQLFIQAVAELTGDDVDVVAATFAEAEREEAQSIAAHKERFGL
jgi:hypothetical protein